MRSVQWAGNTPNAEVDVFITTYNHPLWIEKALRSAVSQKFRKPFNIYLYDDDSRKNQIDPISGLKSESPRQVLWNLKKNYPGVCFELSRHNRGVSAARNYIFEMGSAPYFVFLDGDDTLDRWFLEKAYRRINIAKVDAVYPKMAIFADGGMTFHGSVNQGSGFDLIRLLRGNFIPVTTFCRRECFRAAGGFDTEMQGGFEDWELWIRMASMGVKFLYDLKVVLYYRHHDGARSHEANKNQEEIFSYIRNKHQSLFDRALRPRVEFIDVE